MIPRRTRLRPISKKKLAQGQKYPSLSRSSIKRKTRKPIPKVNVKATRKRRLRNQKRMRGAEYQAARAGAMERSGGRCEFAARVSYGPVFSKIERCPETEKLQFHEEHYARGRILTANDGKMLCPPHHRLAESLKPHKQGKRAYA